MSHTEEPATSDEQPASEALNEQLKEKLSDSALGAAAQKENPTGKDLLKAVGGIRGLVETTLPPLIFLLVFFISGQDLWLSVLVPLAVAVIFVVVRMVSKTEMTSAVAGVIGLGLSAGLALASGNLENNFLLGIITNAVLLIVFLVSVLLKHPVLGYLGALLMDQLGWQNRPYELRLMMYATLVWCAIFAIRLAVQVPLYLTENSAGLAVVKVVLGVPLYALALWLTWLLYRAAFLRKT